MSEEDRTFGRITHEGSDVTQRKARRIAVGFVRSDAMEARLELRERDPDGFASLPRDERLSVAYYDLSRAAAMQAALDDEDEDEAA